MTPPLAGMPCPPSGREDAWVAVPGRWDLYYAVVFTVVLAVIWVGSTPGQRLVAIPAMVAMVPWYVLAGRPIWIRGEGSARRGAAYIAGMFVLFAAAQSQDPNA